MSVIYQYYVNGVPILCQLYIHIVSITCQYYGSIKFINVRYGQITNISIYISTIMNVTLIFK